MTGHSASHEGAHRINLADEPEFSLGGATVKPAELAVVMNSDRHTIQPRVMQVLVALAKGRPAVLSRDKLVELCWGGRIVGDDALNRCILALRHVAQQFTPEPFTIETVPRVGHRLVAAGDVQTTESRPRVSRRAVITTGVGLAAVATAGAWYLLRPLGMRTRRIAVLPFANLSAHEDQAYFAEGMAEELRSALSRIGIEVVGRISSDAVKDMDAKSAAARLGVDEILTGSVRRTRETIRVNAQLVRGSDGIARWAESYDRAPGDEISIQTDIAAHVARALSIALNVGLSSAVALGGTADSLAQDLILQSRQLGREANTEEATRRRIELSERAIARDPRYAGAYIEKANALFGLSITYARSASAAAATMAAADTAARRSIELAPRLGTAHFALAQIAHGRLDFVTALREAQSSLLLSPVDPDVLATGSRYLAYFGRAEEGLARIDKAISLDPLNGRSYMARCAVLLILRRFPDAIDAGRIALELAPDLINAQVFVGDALLLLGKSAAAKAQYDAVPASNPFGLARRSLLAARTADRRAAEDIMAQLRKRVGGAASFQYAEIRAQLGDLDEAFAELEHAVRARDSGLAYLNADPLLDPIRPDPRYALLLKQLQFPL